MQLCKVIQYYILKKLSIEFFSPNQLSVFAEISGNFRRSTIGSQRFSIAHHSVGACDPRWGAKGHMPLLWIHHCLLGIVCRPIESRDEPIALHWRLMLCRRRRATRDSMACSILWLVTLGSEYHAPFQFKGLHEKDLDWKSYKWCLAFWCIWPCLTFHVSSFFSLILPCHKTSPLWQLKHTAQTSPCLGGAWQERPCRIALGSFTRWSVACWDGCGETVNGVLPVILIVGRLRLPAGSTLCLLLLQKAGLQEQHEEYPL